MRDIIPFNKPPYTGKEEKYVLEAIRGDKISGDGPYGKRCQEWFQNKLGASKTLLTPSCTAALEMAAILIDIKPGDEVIMPSYTFVSTANAFVLRGAKIVFVDIRPDTMNIDETKIEAAITDRTKAVVPVHYAGVSCEMDSIMAIAKRYDLYVIEDAAQGVMSSYKGRPLGTIGHLAAFSFHETKNYTSGGEGGLLIINDARFTERAEVIREKGTNRSQFFRGQVDKYTWVDIGSSYLPSEIQAAYLWAQLEKADEINDARLRTWRSYYDSFRELAKESFIELPIIPDYCAHNAHMFYIKVKNLKVRTELLEFLKKKNIFGAFHYIPLHSTPVGECWGRFSENEIYTTFESERLLRLPIFYGIEDEEALLIVSEVIKFFKESHA